MKLIQINPYQFTQIKKSLSKIDEFLSLSTELGKLHSPKESFVDFDEVFNVIYYQFTGESRKDIVKNFRSPSDSDKTKFCAWIHRESNFKNTGFIPDSIDFIILNKDMEVEDKIKEIQELFVILKDVYDSKAYSPITSPIVFSYSLTLVKS